MPDVCLLLVGDFTFHCDEGDVGRAPSDVPPGCQRRCPGGPGTCTLPRRPGPSAPHGHGDGSSGPSPGAVWRRDPAAVCEVSVGARPRSPLFPRPPQFSHACSGPSGFPQLPDAAGCLGPDSGGWPAPGPNPGQFSVGVVTKRHKMSTSERTTEVCSLIVRSQKSEVQGGRGCIPPGGSRGRAVPPLPAAGVCGSPRHPHMAAVPPACVSVSESPLS